MQTTHVTVLGLKPLQNNFSMKIQVVSDVMLALFTNIYWPAVISDQREEWKLVDGGRGEYPQILVRLKNISGRSGFH
jgi:hypothetical protein